MAQFKMGGVLMSQPHRLLIIAPVATIPTVVARIRAICGQDAVPDDLGPGLSATGSDQVTHRWCCGSFGEAETKQIVGELCKAAKIAVPKSSNWDTSNKGQKKQIVANLKTSLRTGAGVYCGLWDNTGQWDSPLDALAEMGLKTIVPVVKFVDPKPVDPKPIVKK